jgi:porphobilinogen synthase
MPEVKRYSPDRVIEFISPLYEKGLAAILLFGVPDTKDIEQTWVDDGIVQKRIPEIRKQLPEIEIIDETLLSMKRAGADRIITCFTPAMLGSSVSTIAG